MSHSRLIHGHSRWKGNIDKNRFFVKLVEKEKTKPTKHISIVDGLAHLFSIHVLSNPSSLAFAATWTENSLSASTTKMKNRNHNWRSSSSFATLPNMQVWWLCKRFSAKRGFPFILIESERIDDVAVGFVWVHAHKGKPIETSIKTKSKSEWRCFLGFL